MTLTQVLVGLTAWAMLSVVVGLVFGAAAEQSGADRDGAPVRVASPRR